MANRDSVLFVRVEPGLVAALDRIVREEKRSRPHSTVSRADIVRVILWDAVNERKNRKHEPQDHLQEPRRDSSGAAEPEAP